MKKWQINKFIIGILFFSLLLSSVLIGQMKRGAEILKDSDSDSIPDAVENLSTSLNAGEDECKYTKFSSQCKDVSLNGLEGNEHFIYLIDQSSSMQEKLGDKSRMEVAKEILSDYIKNLPEQFSSAYEENPMRFGVYVYGHNACEDLKELQSPFKRLKRKTLQEQIQTLNPSGATPIARSLEILAEKIQKKKGKFTIMLVTDGVESCQGDPIAKARELVALNSLERSVKLSVIGLGVPKNIEAELKKIAEASDGSYNTVNSAAEFKQVFVSPFREMVQNLLGLVCMQSVTDKIIRCEERRYSYVEKAYLKISNPFSSGLKKEEREILLEERKEITSKKNKRLTLYNNLKTKGSKIFKAKADNLVKFVGKIQEYNNKSK